jgi:hypothetical protein
MTNTANTVDLGHYRGSDPTRCDGHVVYTLAHYDGESS